MSQAIVNLQAAQQRAIALRPKVGGFPYLAEALRALSKVAVYRVPPAVAPPKLRVTRASKESKRGSPCKCLNRGSRAK